MGQYVKGIPGPRKCFLVLFAFIVSLIIPLLLYYLSLRPAIIDHLFNVVSYLRLKTRDVVIINY